MGPLAVRPGRQGEGIGALIVETGIRWLRDAGARVIGLETMPRTVENIGFYSRLGFRPGYLTVSLTRDLDEAPEGEAGELLSAADGRGLADCAALVEAVAPGLDFAREIVLTRDFGLGDTTLVRDGRGLAGFALWHSAPLAEGKSDDEVRVLKLVARDPEGFGRLIGALEARAWGQGARRVSIRCQTAYRDAYGVLLEAGYRVHWTDLRMTLGGAESSPRAGGVVFSNWEI